MRHVSAVAAAVIFGLGAWQAASAADLPRKAPPPAAVYVPVSTWTGCCIGGNAGAGWGSGEISIGRHGSGSSDSARFAAGPDRLRPADRGRVFGVPTCSTGRTRSAAAPSGAARLPASLPRLKTIGWILLTGRIGYSMQPNRSLYFQGGAAWRKNSLTIINPAGAEVGSTDRTAPVGRSRRLRIQVRAKLVGVRRVQSCELRHHRRHRSGGPRVQCEIGRRCCPVRPELAAGRLPLLSNSQTSSLTGPQGAHWKRGIFHEESRTGTRAVVTALSLGGRFVGKGKAPAPVITKG